MKTPFIPVVAIAAALFVLSCSKRNELDDKIAEAIKKEANDPDSYQPVSTTAFDTVVFADIAKNELKFINEEMISTMDRHVNELLRYADGFGSKQDANEDEKKFKELMQTLRNDSLYYSKFSNDKTLLGYIREHKFRMKNAMGALVLDKVYVYSLPNDSIIKIDKDYRPGYFTSEFEKKKK